MMITLKQNDTGVGIKATLEKENGAIDLTNASVLFLFNGQAIATEVTDPINGEILVTFTSTQTANVGVYKCEFEASFSDGRVETFPDNGYDQIKILKDLGGNN